MNNSQNYKNYTIVINNVEESIIPEIVNKLDSKNEEFIGVKSLDQKPYIYAIYNPKEKQFIYFVESKQVCISKRPNNAKAHFQFIENDFGCGFTVTNSTLDAHKELLLSALTESGQWTKWYSPKWKIGKT